MLAPSLRSSPRALLLQTFQNGWPCMRRSETAERTKFKNSPGWPELISTMSGVEISTVS